MCVVSMIHEHFQTPWYPLTPMPMPIPHPMTPSPMLPFPDWTPIRWAEYQELLRKAAEYDKMTGQSDCPDPKKEERYRELEKFMKDRYGLEPQR